MSISKISSQIILCLKVQKFNLLGQFIKFFSFSLFPFLEYWFHSDVGGDGSDTNTINLDKYFYFPENNSEFSNNFKIALPNPPPQQQKRKTQNQQQPQPQQTTAQNVQSSWIDYTSIQPEKNGISNDLPLELPPLTEIKQEKIDDEYETPTRETIPVWHTAKSTSKITMYPSRDPAPKSVKRRLQQIQPKPPALTPAMMPPLTQIVAQPKTTPKLIAVVKKIIPIQPKSTHELPKLTQIQPKQSSTSSSPTTSTNSSPNQSKLVIKKVSHIGMNTRRHSTGNSSKIVPTKELLESLKQENIIYQDNEDKPWYCKTCGRNYKWRNSLKQHIKNECGNLKIYYVLLNIDRCPYFFNSQVFHRSIIA